MPNRIPMVLTAVLLAVACQDNTSPATTDGLDLWTDDVTKSAIVAFVDSVTDRSGANYLPPEDRVAVFDMDGTILIERPQYVLFDMATRQILEKIARNPELADQQPYRSVSEGNWEYFGDDWYSDTGLYSVLLYAADGLSDAEYDQAIRNYLTDVKDERFGVSYDKLVFAPVVQLIDYLQANQFDVFIVSGSSTAFIRAIAPEAVHVPVDNIIGSTTLTAWESTGTTSQFVRQHSFVQPINDEGGKPVNIRNRIGKVPVIAVGNSTGDYHMLEYSKTAGHSLQLIVNHDDAEREYQYHDAEMQALCEENDWIEISMKDDFKVVFQGL